MIQLYGIANCDTVRKARKWLDANGIDYIFNDYKTVGAHPDKLRVWTEAKGWEALLNKRGTTFRQLDEADRADLDASKALWLMAEHPSLIKRPVVEHAGGLLIGFDEAEWRAALV